jgi:hypothetical protein
VKVTPVIAVAGAVKVVLVAFKQTILSAGGVAITGFGLITTEATAEQLSVFL